MPTFAFVCQCGHAYEEFRWPSEGLPSLCPSCSLPYGNGFEQNWTKNRPLGLCKGEDRITTLGQQVEYNNRRLGKEQLELKARAEQTRYTGIHGKLPEGAVHMPADMSPAEVPWWRDGSIAGTKREDKPLDLRTVKDVDEYIATGEK